METLPSSPAEQADGLAPVTVDRPRFIVRLAVFLAVVGCFVGMGWAFTLNKTPEVPLGTAIEGVEPAYGAAAVPGQTPVRVDLQFGYFGEINVDGRALPNDQVDYEEAQAILTFMPATGKEFSRFTNGLHVAQIVYWPLANPADKRVFQWSFTVV